MIQAGQCGGGVGAVENKARQVRWGPVAAGCVSNSASSEELLRISRSDGLEQAHCGWEYHLGEALGLNCCWQCK